MPDRARPRRPILWWVRAAVVVPGALAIAWLILVTSAGRALPPQLAERVAPGLVLPRTVYREAAQELVTGRGQLRAETYERLASALRREPLASNPFAFGALRILAEGDLAHAERLLLEARRRNPREILTRLLLMSVYLNTGRVKEGTGEISSMLRIMPRAQEVLIPELTKLAVAPKSRNAVLQAIGDSSLMTAVLDHLAARGADTQLILALAARQRPSTTTFAQWQTRVLQRLSEAGEVRRAYDLWLRFLGQTEAPASTIYDPDFKGLPGPPPFNWALHSSELGSAEFVAGEAIEVTYFGRGPAALARQLLLLRPGQYTFEVQAEGQANGQGSKLVWRLGCQGLQSPLLSMPLEQVTYTPKRLSGRFSVPGGCGAQWLELVGVPAEFPTAQSARVTGVQIVRSGAAR